MPEFIELTDEELAIVAGGVSLSGGFSTGFTGGIGSITQSGANGTGSLSMSNGGTVGAATLASFVLAASPPNS